MVARLRGYSYRSTYVVYSNSLILIVSGLKDVQTICMMYGIDTQNYRDNTNVLKP